MAKKSKSEKGLPPAALRSLLAAMATFWTNGKLKKPQLEQRQEFKKTRRHALELIAAQPELGDGNGNIGAPVPNFELPHATHRIVTFHGDDSTIDYNNCSGWSSRTMLKLISFRMPQRRRRRRLMLR